MFIEKYYHLEISQVKTFIYLIDFQIPEEWISDERCFRCRYSKRSSPNLCHCRQSSYNTNRYIDARKTGIRNPNYEQNQGPPIPPVRSNSLTRGKKKKVLFVHS